MKFCKEPYLLHKALLPLATVASKQHQGFASLWGLATTGREKSSLHSEIRLLAKLSAVSLLGMLLFLLQQLETGNICSILENTTEFNSYQLPFVFPKCTIELGERKVVRV